MSWQDGRIRPPLYAKAVLFFILYFFLVADRFQAAFMPWIPVGVKMFAIANAHVTVVYVTRINPHHRFWPIADQFIMSSWSALP